MPHPHQLSTMPLGTDEEVILYDVPAPFRFERLGVTYYVVPPGYGLSYAIGRLRTLTTTTYRVARITRIGIEIYLCRMDGSDGSRIDFHLSKADLEHNREIAASFAAQTFTETIQLEAVA
jgi:hypothetical protein